MKKLFYCSSCRNWFSGEEKETTCNACGGGLIPIDYDYDQYNSMNQEEKRKFREDYIKSNDLVIATQLSSNAYLHKINNKLHFIVVVVWIYILVSIFMMVMLIAK